ncbi:MAG TPA: hypothetical protein VEC15_11645 [Actinomycetota bacterium]|nr:hypothetical protein [Actinomycetota bacterium]
MRVAMIVLGGWIGSSVVLSLLVGRILARQGSDRGDARTRRAAANVIPIAAGRRVAPRTAAPVR